MKVKVFDGYFNNGWVEVELPFLQWLRLKLHGFVYFKHDMKDGWKGKLPFYIVRCPRHGYFLDYLHGVEGYNAGFGCPLCLEETVRKFKLKKLEVE